ncbi:osmosensing histidine protein kinase SLN1 [Xylaria venustula]|nr:osmosensing histidine protein kinase SLN1 [Xylaria venustula]
MRIAIREQLAALVLLAVLIALTIVAVPTWVYVHRFVVNVESDGLSLTASLKAAQIASQIELISTACIGITTRLLVQASFLNFYKGNYTADNWSSAVQDLQTALNNGGTLNLLQAKLFSRNATGDPNGLVNVTADNISDILLPYMGPDGSDIYLGNTTFGYPPMLYPNITYYPSTDPDPFNPGNTLVVARPFPDIRIDSGSDGLVLGPLVINDSYALVSLTLPVRWTPQRDIILGYMTVVAEATTIIDIATSLEGLGNTGTVLLIGPATGWNRFSKYNLPATATSPATANFSSVDVQFVLPPALRNNQTDRHNQHDSYQDYNKPFKVTDYNAAYKAFTKPNPAVNNASSMLSTTNEQGVPVAVGFARPPTTLVNWTLIVEQSMSEAFIPIYTLQHILLGTVFGTTGVVLLFIFPCAHLSVKPIRNLKAATEKSISPPGYEEVYDDDPDYDEDLATSRRSSSKMSRKFFGKFRKWYRGSIRPKAPPSERPSEARRHVFKIPGKVPTRKYFVTDELTELTTTFNEMSDELLRQYSSMEDKVASRTRELEESKKAAEAANESKTLFIANISHELKTPLNGILGMASVCMEEDDLGRIKQSLKVLYKSGDLLFHLLEDLLNFSKNQIGNQLSLDEREFRLGDIRSQILTIFDKQAREGQITFSVDFSGADIVDPNPEQNPERSSFEEKLPVLGPRGLGRMKDMYLWGDQHRILQVLINLVSNSLKFTPAQGRVSVRIKCIGEAESSDESRASSFSRSTSYQGRHQHRGGSMSNHSTTSRDMPTPGTALSINPLDPKIAPHLFTAERSQTPPPQNAKPFVFEFEVEDTGPGIPEHMRARVFEPFVQGDLGLTKKYGGTGLGLSICQQLANLMGGNITMSSSLGIGTVFSMRIPLKYTKDRSPSTASSSIKSRPNSVTSADGDIRRSSLPQTSAEVKASVLDQQPRLVGLSQPFFAANPKPESKPTPDDQMKAAEKARADKGEGRLRVLVAEDNPTNIEVVSRMLKLEDVYDVTIAKDGQEAYDLVKANMENNTDFDLIFMDIQMPNVDGLQSTRLIREIGYSAPIVALTAFSDESNVKNCIESGMNEFLSKPIRRPALKRVLKKFATIPEEPETTISRRPTPEKGSPVVKSQPLNGRISPELVDPIDTVSTNGQIPTAAH